jgi:endonuclease I
LRKNQQKKRRTDAEGCVYLFTCEEEEEQQQQQQKRVGKLSLPVSDQL